MGCRIRLPLALLVLVGATGLAAAPAPAESTRPGFENLRYKEDWSALRNSPGPASYLDPIRYIPFDDEGRFWLSFGGQLRGRLEVWNNFLFGSSRPKDDDVFFLGRVRVHANLELTRYFRVFAEFKSSFLSERQLLGGSRPSEDFAALQNAFAEIRYPTDAFTVGAQGGRREMQIGVQRLVSPLDWSNLRRTFDGASAYVKGEGWEAEGFWSRPVVVRRAKFNKSGNEGQFYGLHGTVPIADSGLAADAYWFGLDLATPRANNGTKGPVDRHTIGGRIYGVIPHTPLEVDLEGAGQFGSIGNESISAGMVSLLLTWPFESIPLEPAVFVGYDYASGDGGDDGKVGTFDQLFPLGHSYLGLIDYVARQNENAIQAGFFFKPVERGVLKLNVLSFWLADVNDALYNAGGIPIRLNPNASSKHVGTEIDLTFNYRFSVLGLSTQIGYSHFFTGDYLAESGPDKDSDFFWAQLVYTF